MLAKYHRRPRDFPVIPAKRPLRKERKALRKAEIHIPVIPAKAEIHLSHAF
jgi:hypothetical protein